MRDDYFRVADHTARTDASGPTSLCQHIASCIVYAFNANSIEMTLLVRAVYGYAEVIPGDLIAPLLSTGREAAGRRS